MYKVLCDDTKIFDSRVEELALINPVLKLEENKAGSFAFTMSPTHPMYDAVKKRESLIQVYRDDEMLFCGVCIKETKNFYKQKTITCEGELSFLNDTIQRPKRYQGATARGLLEEYITNHNAQVEENKRFVVGQVTVKDPNDYIYCYTNMESTLKSLKEDLVDDLGGIVRIRHEGGIRYLDYLADSPNTNTQIIKIGENLMDFTVNNDSTDIATAIIPLGCKLETSPVEGLEVRLTIESVNAGCDYVYSQNAVDTYGWIYKTVEWDDVTTPSALKSKGEKYLSDIQFENMVIEAKAVDLHLTDKQIEQFRISDKIRVVSPPHGLDRYFRLTKQTINLNSPEKDTITLGKDERLSLSAKTNRADSKIKKTIESIVPASKILSQAVANATQLIQTATNGYVTTVMNADGTPKELLIMDTNNTETATKVWRWNINGLGYSGNGYKGPYTLAMTMDGCLVADFIKAGTMFADRIRGGKLTLGGTNNEHGIVVVLDKNGAEKARWDASGINARGSLVSDGKTTIDGTTVNQSYEIKGGHGTINLADKIAYKYGVVGSDVDKMGIMHATSLSRLVLGTINDTGESPSIFYQLNNGYNPSGYTERHILRGEVRITDTVTALEYAMANEGAKLYGAKYDSLPAVISSGGFYANGSMGCSGTKYRVVDTKYGKIGMNAFETAEAYFADLGNGVIPDSGVANICLDPIFADTVDLAENYQVFITNTSPRKVEWVEKEQGTFAVHGEPGASFDWMICCKQKGYAGTRMKHIDIAD